MNATTTQGDTMNRVPTNLKSYMARVQQREARARQLRMRAALKGARRAA